MLSDEERQAIEEQYKEGLVNLSNVIEPLINQFKTDYSLDIQQCRLIINYLLMERDFNEDYYDELDKEIEEYKREKETNQQMIKLAETQILGYGQGYKDGLNKETTATAIVARERENQILYEGMKHKINMEWVLKIKAILEEYKYTEIGDSEKIIEFYKKIQSLLEKE